MADLKQHRRVTLLRITQQSEERGARRRRSSDAIDEQIELCLAKGNLESLSVFSLKGAIDEIAVLLFLQRDNRLRRGGERPM